MTFKSEKFGGKCYYHHVCIGLVSNSRILFLTLTWMALVSSTIFIMISPLLCFSLMLYYCRGLCNDKELNFLADRTEGHNFAIVVLGFLVDNDILFRIVRLLLSSFYDHWFWKYWQNHLSTGDDSFSNTWESKIVRTLMIHDCKRRTILNSVVYWIGHFQLFLPSQSQRLIA